MNQITSDQWDAFISSTTKMSVLLSEKYTGNFQFMYGLASPNFINKPFGYQNTCHLEKQCCKQLLGVPIIH